MKKRLVIFFLAAAMVLGGCENKNSKLYKKGIEALEQKDYVTSIAMLEGAVKAGDRLAESYRSLGIAYLKSQEYDKAKEAFKSSLFEHEAQRRGVFARCHVLRGGNLRTGRRSGWSH